jgi:hypothetical protein
MAPSVDKEAECSYDVSHLSGIEQCVQIKTQAS